MTLESRVRFFPLPPLLIPSERMFLNQFLCFIAENVVPRSLILWQLAFSRRGVVNKFSPTKDSGQWYTEMSIIPMDPPEENYCKQKMNIHKPPNYPSLPSFPTLSSKNTIHRLIVSLNSSLISSSHVLRRRGFA